MPLSLRGYDNPDLTQYTIVVQQQHAVEYQYTLCAKSREDAIRILQEGNYNRHEEVDVLEEIAEEYAIGDPDWEHAEVREALSYGQRILTTLARGAMSQ